VERGVLTDQRGIDFSSIVGVLGEGDGCADVGEHLQTCELEFEFRTIEEKDVLKLLRGVDPNKAVGVDMQDVCQTSSNYCI
jgi:hypothetical protein